MTSLLQARDLCFRYRPGADAAVQNFSLNLDSGDFVGIVGPNGSGKSTAMRLLYGALRPVSGEVLLCGKPMRQWSGKEVARKIAVVGQEPFWNFPITVHDFVLQGRYPHLGRFGFETDEDVARVEEALQRVDLAPFSDRTVQEISAGERQRMLLARALAQQPEIFMLDEPTANLDLRYQVELLQLMRELQRQSGFAVLLISHELALIVEFVQRLVLFRDGTTLAQGTPDAVVTADHLEKLFKVPFRVDRSPAGGRKYWIFPETQIRRP